MLDEIKIYWQQIKNEYENKYADSFLKDYEKSKEFLQRMQNYLLKKQTEFSNNIDIICTLASVKLELRENKDDCIKLLECFLHKFENILNNTQKARIYTNMAFYADYSTLTLKYLKKAFNLQSNFSQTYKGLGLYYFSEYEIYKDIKILSLSKKYFEIAKNMNENYENNFNYAVCLYELNEYEKAKEIFINLLKQYPNRRRIMLCISYCEAYLKNKEKAKFYLQQIKSCIDNNYCLETDEISEYEIYNVYYMLNELDEYLNYWSEDDILKYYIADMEHYFYALWIKNKKELFFKFEKQYKEYFKNSIKEAIIDEDYESEEEKQEFIDDCKKEAKEFDEMISNIKNGILKPEIKLPLYPEYSCFVIDCIRHNF